MSAKVTVVGSLNFDVLLGMDALPVVGETRIARSAATAGGGKGANQAVQAAKLGAWTAMVGAVGTDAIGASLVSDLEAYGVDTSRILRKEAPTGLGIVSYLEDGSLSATISRGANFELTPGDIDDVGDLIDESDVVLFQLENPIETVVAGIRRAREADAFVVLNGAPAAEVDSQTLSLVDCFVVNEVEAAFYLGLAEPLSAREARSVGPALLEQVAQSVVITLGPEGALLFEKNGVTSIPAEAVVSVETTGAGDSFIGAMSVLIAEGKPIAEACRFASCASALTVQGVGAQGSMPDRGQVESAYPFLLSVS